MKYRKKPIIVDAFKWTNDSDGKQPPQWFFDNLNVGEEIDCHMRVVTKGNGLKVRITTFEGVVYAAPDDYIIKGVNGEFCPCSPDRFEATYELVEEGT